jgi:citrate lyase subunit beta / citryl-CoA lyase
MTAHSAPISSRFVAGIAFGIVVFPAGRRAVYRVGVGKEIQDREMNKMAPPLRSFLFAPGNHARRVEKALSLDADAVILDLEDAVAIAEKSATREVVAAALERPRQGLLYVRVNAVDTKFCYDDLVAVVQPGLDGIILPKVESATGLATIDWLLSQLERDRGLPLGDIDLIPIIETARGVQQIDAVLAAGTRVQRVAFGAGDFTFDVNMAWSRSETELAHARAVIVTASRASGIDAPLDTVWVDLTDPEGLEASAQTALGYGFQGKMCIHPDQIAVVNRVFTPTDAEIAFAERVTAAFASAEAEGSAAIQLDGKFIDYPIVHRAQRVLQKIAAIRAREGR